MGQIDCLFVGHNEMKFGEYEKITRSMGEKSGAYRDLNLNFIQYKGKLYTAPEAYNLFCHNESSNGYCEPISLGNVFSATIAYLGTFLNKRGFIFDYVNSFQDEKGELADKLRNNDILAIAIPTTLYVSPFPILEIVSFVRQYNTSAKLIIGGPFIATQTRTQDNTTLQYLFNLINADFYINSSQGEAALANILNALKMKSPVDSIDNIYYRSGESFIPTATSIEDNKLEENMVDWSLFPEIGRFAAMRTSISCPFSCSFCGFPQHAGKYQTASIEAIEKELDSIDSSGTVRSLNFIDDTFNVPPNRFKDILRIMIKNNYKFKWNSHFRCQYADEEMIELMKESGCEGVFLGIESGNQQILQNMNKKATIEKYRQGISLLNKNGIITYASFIIGFPGETYDTVKDTIDFINETKPTFFRTQLWYCDPFTSIWKEREKYDIVGSQFEWSHSTMDSQTACNIINEVFLSEMNSIWVPQTNFEFEGVFNLLHRGIDLEGVKRFIKGFNLGIKEKLLNPANKEISRNTANIIREACCKLKAEVDGGIGLKEISALMEEAEFDF